MDRYFGFSERNTGPRTEIVAGLTTFTAIPTLPPTFDTSCGIGFISYVPIKLARGRPGEVRPLL